MCSLSSSGRSPRRSNSFPRSGRNHVICVGPVSPSTKPVTSVRRSAVGPRTRSTATGDTPSSPPGQVAGGLPAPDSCEGLLRLPVPPARASSPSLRPQAGRARRESFKNPEVPSPDGRAPEGGKAPGHRGELSADLRGTCGMSHIREQGQVRASTHLSGPTTVDASGGQWAAATASHCVLLPAPGAGRREQDARTSSTSAGAKSVRTRSIRTG